MSTAARIPGVFARWGLGEPASIAPCGGGHINDSWRIDVQAPSGPRSYFLQRINTRIFPDPDRICENIARITAHIAAQIPGNADRRALRLVAPRDRATADESRRRCSRDEAGDAWRLYDFIPGTVTHLQPASPRHAEQAGRAFGRFQRQLSTLPPPRLFESLPDFHNTPLRLAAFEQAVREDRAGRAADIRPEIEFALGRRPLAGLLVDQNKAGRMPERAVHNDAKISNVLFDETTDEALCIVDLDLVMPGLALFDFGDMMRSMLCPAPEDETDLARVEISLPLYEGLAHGYLEGAGDLLTAAEREHLVSSGLVITYEQALRFLGDYLNGDVYYKTSRPEQNLDRARCQLKLLESMERNCAAMQAMTA